MKAISYKLWIADRNYPLVPWVDMPSAMHLILLFASAVLLAWLIYNPQNKSVIIAALLTESITILGDQNRLQPWHYQYLFTFFAIVANYKYKKKVLQGIVLITVATYLFSGLQKINSGFLRTIWSVHLLRRFLGVPEHIIHNRLVHFAGLIIPLIEVSGAMGLLFLRTMKPAAWLLISMHIFILIFIGPLNFNYNMVVWPWNVQMILLLYFLFLKEKLILHQTTFRSIPNYIIAWCWIVLPIAGLFGYWDKFLSAGMYSGREKLLQFYFADSTQIPTELKPYAFYSKKNTSAGIVLTDWCLKELNVAAVTEPRVVNSITQQMNERYAARHIRFELTERH